eukprot:3969964-Pleurochrysis_carterae.AAC.1
MSTPKHESTTMAITSQPNEFNSKAMRYGTTMMETMISKHMYRSHATFHRAPIGTMYQGRGISSTTAATDGRRLGEARSLLRSRGTNVHLERGHSRKRLQERLAREREQIGTDDRAQRRGMPHAIQNGRLAVRVARTE